MLKPGTKPPVPAWIGNRHATYQDGEWIIVFTNFNAASRALGDIQTEVMNELDVVVALDRMPDTGNYWYIGEVK